MAGFTEEEIRLAQETQARYGVPASVTLAQYALESGWGSSNLAQKAQNYFGITGKNHSTGQYVTMSGRTWAKYGSKAESFYDHGRLLSTDLYASKTAGAQNVSQYIDAIAETYAPSSDGNNDYAGKLKNIINSYNLTQYDTVSGTSSGSNLSYVGATAVDTSEEGGVLAKIVKFIALLLLGVLAAVFFFSAFDIHIKRPKKAAAEVAEKVVGEDG